LIDKKISVGKTEERNKKGGQGEAVSRKWDELIEYEFSRNNWKDKF
jgi:hypothetical protein